MKIMKTLTVNGEDYKPECGDGTYYKTLAAAVADVNTGTRDNALTDVEQATVRVYTDENGAKTVQLLQDVELDTVVTFERDARVLLAGHTLRLTAPAYLQFMPEISCTVEAAGGSMIKTQCYEDQVEDNSYLILSQADRLRVLGGNYHIASGNCKSVTAVRSLAGQVYLQGCHIRGETNAPAKRVRVLQSESLMILEDCHVEAYGSKQVIGGMIYADTVLRNCHLELHCDAAEIADTDFACGFYMQENDCTLTLEKTKITVQCLSINSVTACVFVDPQFARQSVYATDCELTAVNDNRVSAETVIKAHVYGLCLDANLEGENGQLINREHKALVRNCRVEAKMTNPAYGNPPGGAQSYVYGVVNGGGHMQIYDCSVMTDSPNNCHKPKNEELGTEESSVYSGGIRSESGGTLICENTTAVGTHSGLLSEGELYVNGGMFSGHSHGGMYLTPESGSTVYIKDAVLEVGVYRGELTEIYDRVGTDQQNRPQADALAGFYYGNIAPNRPGSTVYMDGCSLRGVAGETFVVRPAASGQCNTLYLSNTDSQIMTKYGNIRLAPVRLNKYAGEILTEERAALRLGAGCGIRAEEAYFTAPESLAFVTETGALYRMHRPEETLNGKDYRAERLVVAEALDAILALQEALLSQ